MDPDEVINKLEEKKQAGKDKVKKAKVVRKIKKEIRPSRENC